jgi:tetrahydromethanopterin S-methyltransferase subunit G
MYNIHIGPIYTVLTLYFYVVGVKNNISLLRDIMTEPKFVNGELSTNYLQQVTKTIRRLYQCIIYYVILMIYLLCIIFI